MPCDYETDGAGCRGLARQRVTRASEQNIQDAKKAIIDQACWLSDQLWTAKEHAGAVRAALLWRYLTKGETREGGLPHADPRMIRELNDFLSRGGYLYAGIDHLAEILDGVLGKAP